MVKPSKSMQPEHVDLQQAAKRVGKGAAFGEDSFRNYMALKIATQRQQFGLVLPPPPQQQQQQQQQQRQASKQDPPPKHEKTPSKPSLPPIASPPRYRPKPAEAIPASRKRPNQDTKPTIYKRPTLLERSSLAPLSRMPPSATTAAATTTATTSPARSVRFADDLERLAETTTTKQSEPPPNFKKTKMESMIGRLKKRHGRGNRRLEQKTIKKRKREEIINNNKVDNCDESSNVQRESPLGPSEQEDGLAELARLFAMTDETEIGNNNGQQHSESADCKEKESERNPKEDRTPTPPMNSDIAAGEKILRPVIQNGLAELDRIFASSEMGKDGKFPSSHCDNNEKDHRDNFTESDKLVSTVREHKDGDDDSFCVEDFITENDGKPMLQNELNEAIPETKLFHEIDEEEAEEDSSIPSAGTTPSARPPSPKTMRRLRPDLFFYGIVVKVAGYTYPDNETIKRLLQKHGGDLETYETERVTHIIAQQLSTAKANLYKKARRPRPVCRPSWIVDSVKEGKLLPHGEYLLIEERDQQQMGIQTMFKKRTEAIHPNPAKLDTSPWSPQKSSMIHKNPYAKQSNSIQSSPKRDSNPSLEGETEQEKKIFETPHDHSGNRESPKKTDSRLINGKIRTVGTDPNFLDSYFASSRLSFIGSYKQRAPSAHLSNGTGSSHASSGAKKLIFHVDMDCFFASVVLRNYPQYQDRPVVISHHGNRSELRKDNERGNNASFGHVPKNSSSECATCNYEARKYGIKKGMFLGRAKELCPELIVLMYDFEGYEEVSQQVLEILDRLASSETHPGVVETVSCDESYVELSFDGSEQSEKLYDRAFQVAETLRNEIFETTRCTASIGVGENKFLAKLGTDKAKPNKSYCVRDYRELLKELRLRDVHGVGWRTERKLMEEGLVTVQDIWDLGSRGESELVRILGPGNGKKIYSFTQGKDDRPITPVERKTIGAECNYGVRFDGPYGIDHFMEGLAKEVQKRMEGISMKGKKLTLKIKKRKENATRAPKFLGHGSCHNLSKSIDIPGNASTRDFKIFTKLGLSLFKEFAIVDIHDIRGMGITISNLEADNDSGKQMNPSGMQHWLQQSIERECRQRDKGENLSKTIPSGSTTATHSDVQTTPDQNKKSEGMASMSSLQTEVCRQESPLAVQLPPMSQIHMSQVEALPPDLQREVRFRMGKGAIRSLEKEPLKESIDEGGIVEGIDAANDFIDLEYQDGKHSLQTTPQSILKSNAQTESTGSKRIESPLLIELPPMSQIQMSQVEALPPEMKEQIYSRMNRTVKEPEIVDMTEAEEPETCALANQQQGIEQQESANRFRQTDLKRMMKLAAVRSGQEQTNISLTQLDQLPLEIRLQVVNGDNQQVGVLSQHAHRFSKKKSAHNSVHNAEQTIPNTRAMATRKQPKQPDTNNKTKQSPVIGKQTNQPKQREFQIIDRVDVWKEDLLPLKEFLNDNCPVQYPKSIDTVLEFLSIVVREGRLPAMVTMIRCIRNRSDGWGRAAVLEKIVRSVNALHIELYEAGLDVAWLMGVDKR